MPAGSAYGLYTKSDGGPNYTIASITLSGTTATVTLNNASNALVNGDSIYISGAAQSQYDGSFDIANVTVSSTAGTTTFTYTVTGSPTSPATPLAGESITAAAGTTNFTLLETPEFGTLSGTTYSGAAQSIPYVSPLVTDEIMYDPPQPTAAETADGYVDSDFEYVELYNRSSSPSRSAITTLRAGPATRRAGSPTAPWPTTSPSPASPSAARRPRSRSTAPAPGSRTATRSTSTGPPKASTTAISPSPTSP